jgi:hypothetical protein
MHPRATLSIALRGNDGVVSTATLIVGAAAAAATQNDVLVGGVAGLRRYDGSRRHSVHF